MNLITITLRIKNALRMWIQCRRQGNCFIYIYTESSISTTATVYITGNGEAGSDGTPGIQETSTWKSSSPNAYSVASTTNNYGGFHNSAEMCSRMYTPQSKKKCSQSLGDVLQSQKPRISLVLPPGRVYGQLKMQKKIMLKTNFNWLSCVLCST